MAKIAAVAAVVPVVFGSLQHYCTTGEGECFQSTGITSLRLNFACGVMGDEVKDGKCNDQGYICKEDNSATAQSIAEKFGWDVLTLGMDFFAEANADGSCPTTAAAVNATMGSSTSSAHSICPEDKPTECALQSMTYNPDVECYNPATHQCIPKQTPKTYYCDMRFYAKNIVCGLTEQVCDGKCVPADGICSLIPADPTSPWNFGTYKNQFYEADENMKECSASPTHCSYGCKGGPACPRWVCHQTCLSEDPFNFTEEKWNQCGGPDKPEWCCSAPFVELV